MSLHKDYFDAVYTDNADPFQLDDNWYETRKYAITMASLPRRRYRRALEPGCSIGILTAELSARCESLISTDVAPAALDAARARVNSDKVQFLEWSLTGDWDAVSDGDSFDLIVLSEVGYYLDEPDLRHALDAAAANLEPGGTLLAVHWRHPVADYPLSGDKVHAVIGATDGLVRMGGYVDEDVILEVFEVSTAKPDSVARIEGLV
ncbi:SAM-dependent methyltransferase [Rhodococcus sp. G-MC3]|uniref:SAM-dependent methyltransferase n=1 Tax=Rhodococcus sp. G-MC3 TaxID=3046209 RepID=UPI0024B8D86F|nr:SAM-dependent methyltransferase [Rhodococcus sp. G-MC3]MDJ0394606.1 SAM-dependent methyltransferase [Rhodococcus sp. G-MC3]